MKRLALISRGSVAAVALFLGCARGFTQMQAAPVSAAIGRLFGDNPSFTAKANVQVLDDARLEIYHLPMTFAMQDRSLRSEADLAQMTSREVGPEVVAQYKKLGIERVVSITRPDKKAVYLIFPSSRAYVNSPMTKDEIEASAKNLQLQKTPLGQEKIDSHPCTKNRATVKGPGGTVLEALTWNASDLKDFPVQIETAEGGRIVVLKFSDIQFGKPDAALFEVPPGYKQYKDPQTLIQENSKRAGEAPH